MFYSYYRHHSNVSPSLLKYLKTSYNQYINGGEYWRLKYCVAGKEKLLALGVYPEVTLADAPAKLEEAKRGISGGIDLMEVKREEKIARETQLNNTFKDIALEWHSNKL